MPKFHDEFFHKGSPDHEDVTETKKASISTKNEKPTCGSCRFFWKGTSLSDPRCTLNGRHVDGDDVCSRWAPKREKKSWRKQQQKPNLPKIWPVQRVRG